jgi:tetratricopeptide (TPR) repeat protein
MSDTEPTEDLEGRFASMYREIYDASTESRARTAVRLATEMRRLARAEHRLLPYIQALFTQTNKGTRTLQDPELGREAAVELIAVLESEDRARLVQPDLDLAAYEEAVAERSSCAYDNLASAVAYLQGYNSAGLRDVVNEGIQICRRTGKLPCITCFREYAAEVRRAGDDLEMALHHARQVIEHGKDPARGDFDRRWSGADCEVELLTLSGQLDAAEAAAGRAMVLAAGYHDPYAARIKTYQRLEALQRLRGDAESEPDTGGLEPPPPGEAPDYEFRRDLNGALRATVRGEHDAAIRLLSDWDRRLTERQCLPDWFETRLRLIAAHRLAGRNDRVAALARPLEARAREADDWLTLRRLARLLDTSEVATPHAAVAPFTSGPYAGPQTATAPTPPTADGPSPQANAPAEATPLEGEFAGLLARMNEASDPEVRRALREAILAFGPDRVVDPRDAARLLGLIHYLVEDASDAERTWRWAEALTAPFAQNATVLNQVAALGDTLRDLPDSPVAETISARHVEALFRRSLDLDPNDAGNFARAGGFFLGQEALGEAERCLARGFRLARGNTFLALRLADLYSQSDRPRDALAVLDMALREGCNAPEAAWKAALLAHNLDRFDALLTYLDRFEELHPGQPWAEFYRASGLLRLGRAADARAALDEEERRNPTAVVPITVLRACAAAGLNDVDDLRRRLAEVLAAKLSTMTDLTFHGLVRLSERLWQAAKTLPDDEPLRQALIARLLETGLAPNDLFDAPRRANPKREGLNFYVCTVVQPLDDSWADSHARLDGESDWTSYRLPWGVLAPGEAEAEERVLGWQARCYPLPAHVEETEQRDDGYADHPGVVWQGQREGITENDE